MQFNDGAFVGTVTVADGDDVRIVFKHLPLSIHPKAPAAHAASWATTSHVWRGRASQQDAAYSLRSRRQTRSFGDKTPVSAREGPTHTLFAHFLPYAMTSWIWTRLQVFWKTNVFGSSKLQRGL